MFVNSRGISHLLSTIHAEWYVSTYSNWNRRSLWLARFLFSRYKYALPGFEKRIIDNSREGKIKELEYASANIATSRNEPAYPDGNGKWLDDNWYMYQPEIEDTVVDRYNQCRYK